MSSQTALPQRLYLMQVATRHAADMPWPIPYPCYLIQLSDGKYILIDTGWPEGLSLPNIELHQNVVEQLALLNVRPEEIKMLICTHFDLDHVGMHSTFTNAELIVQREHYELARSGYERFASGRPLWDHSALRYRLVDGDTELLPGLKLLATHGHIRGHQSVLVHLPELGSVLLTIDAVLNQGDFRPDRQPRPFDEDQDGELVRAGARKLIEVAEHEQAALIIFGHDGQQWPTLKKLPAYYQ
ncbi:N-acyl homoserine lactonase family protein [Ktedonosporobacter rubrisoli]|uniref:N-acyl homoserine lactonase family protein n=1 Tax=Ktedonosporobacter rubrisoli TaxID=2509675 RepID=A0A4P6JZ30_KTERU|nr:N-acyl homoserine lactonase family protein [Ktedonosporobacter rubrisoli]QBD80743.1 N-acyl homoserine lactonase family protein [Ktedonosporobacter rubrisoli]